MSVSLISAFVFAANVDTAPIKPTPPIAVMETVERCESAQSDHALSGLWEVAEHESLSGDAEFLREGDAFVVGSMGDQVCLEFTSTLGPSYGYVVDHVEGPMIDGTLTMNDGRLVHIIMRAGSTDEVEVVVNVDRLGYDVKTAIIRATRIGRSG